MRISLSGASGLELALLQASTSFAPPELPARALVQIGPELAKAERLPVLGEVDAQAGRDFAHRFELGRAADARKPRGRR